MLKLLSLLNRAFAGLPAGRAGELFEVCLFLQVSCFEGVGAAALGAPIVGYLCENVFGYVKPTHGRHFVRPSEEIRLANARAISLSMLCMTVGPWLLNVLAYGILHITYKLDSRHGSTSAGTANAASTASRNNASKSTSSLAIKASVCFVLKLSLYCVLCIRR